MCSPSFECCTVMGLRENYNFYYEKEVAEVSPR